jgi:hypothetical protein
MIELIAIVGVVVLSLAIADGSYKWAHLQTHL